MGTWGGSFFKMCYPGIREEKLGGKSMVEKMAVERKPGGKKAWSIWKRWEKSGFIHIKINDEVKHII